MQLRIVNSPPAQIHTIHQRLLRGAPKSGQLEKGAQLLGGLKLLQLEKLVEMVLESHLADIWGAEVGLVEDLSEGGQGGVPVFEEAFEETEDLVGWAFDDVLRLGVVVQDFDLESVVVFLRSAEIRGVGVRFIGLADLEEDVVRDL